MPQQVWAAAVLVAFLAIIFIGLHILTIRRSSAYVPDDAATPGPVSVNWTHLWSLVGLDNRVSTSRTVALLWTVIIGYCLLALVLIATARHSAATPIPSGRIPDGFIDAALKPLAPAYIVVLGAPYGAAIGAQLIVTQGTASGRIQKTRSQHGPNPLDVVSDDDGNVDLVDLQYTLFNLIAMVFVLTQFIPHASQGIVTIPPALATLTGISAALYTANKAVGSNRAQLSSVVTPSVHPGQPVTVTGHNLVVNPDPSNADTAVHNTTVTLTRVDDGSGGNGSGVTSESVAATNATPDHIEFKAPDDLAPGIWNVRVHTNAAGTAILRGQLTVLPPSGTHDSVESIGTP